MAKPIGNLVVNLKSNDKVSRRITARFDSKSSLDALAHATKPAQERRKVTKYKTRKK